MCLDSFVATGEGKPNDVSDFFDEATIRIRRAAQRLVDRTNHVGFKPLKMLWENEKNG